MPDSNKILDFVKAIRQAKSEALARKEREEQLEIENDRNWRSRITTEVDEILLDLEHEVPGFRKDGNTLYKHTRYGDEIPVLTFRVDSWMFEKFNGILRTEEQVYGVCLDMHNGIEHRLESYLYSGKRFYEEFAKIVEPLL